MARWVVGLLLLLMASSAEAACRTITLPDSRWHGGTVTAQPGSNYLVKYTPPAGATSVGLEFWFHAFPPEVTPGTQYLLAYLNETVNDPSGKRMFHAANIGPEAGTGWGPAFAMSTFIHAGEEFVVNWFNATALPVAGYLIVTLRECMP